MAVYYIMLAILLLLAGWMTFSKYKYSSLITALLGFLLLSYVSMNRFKIGYDYGPYAQMFQTYGNYNFEQLSTAATEKGYAVLNYFVGFFTLNYRYLFTITSLLNMAGVCYYLYKKSTHVGLSLLVLLCFGFYYNSFNFIRQFMAAVVLLLSYQYLIKRDLAKYILFVLFAGTFHMSALIMIPFYWILHISVTHKAMLSYAFIAAIIYLNSQSFFALITTHVYKSYNPITSIEMTIGIPVSYMIPFIITFILAYSVRTELIEQNKENTYYINSLACIIFFQLIGTKHAIVSRFILLFAIPAVCLLIPSVIQVYCMKLRKTAILLFQEKDSDHRLSIYFKKHALEAVFIVLIILGCIGNHQYLLSRNYNGVVPYEIYPMQEVIE